MSFLREELLYENQNLRDEIERLREERLAFATESSAFERELLSVTQHRNTLLAEIEHLKERVKVLQTYFDVVEDTFPEFTDPDDDDKYWDAKAAVLGPLEEVECNECDELFMPETYDSFICDFCWERIVERDK